VLAVIDIYSTQKRVYGHKKEGVCYRHTKIKDKSVLVRGLNELVASVTTPLAALVAAATRLRGGNVPLGPRCGEPRRPGHRHRPVTAAPPEPSSFGWTLPATPPP
jgi:hypothetical protein